jgi:hypothetical protein
MRIGLRVLLLCLALGLAGLAGCMSPPAVPFRGGPAFDPLFMREGWMHANGDASYKYGGGVLMASFAGDELLLRISVNESVDLGRVRWEYSGTLPPEVDRSFPILLAIWNEAEPWPRWGYAGHYVQDFAGLTIGAAGVSHHIDDPQWLIFDLLFESNGSYEGSVELSDPLVLDSGVWRLWFSIPGSVEMIVRMGVPEVSLASLPSTDNGCSRVAPDEFEGELMAYLGFVGVAHRVRWGVDVAGNQTLVGFVTGSVGIHAWEIAFVFPSGERWRHARLPSGSETEPPGWPLALAATTPGRHNVELVYQSQLSLAAGQSLVYCMI